jgi:hypothetical protein
MSGPYRLPGPLEAERQALLRVLDHGESACPDCITAGVRVTWLPDARRWRVSVSHGTMCAVPRRARSRRAYERWLADQLAATGARVAHYASTADLEMSHR